MTNDIAKKQPLELDSIDDFDDSIIDGDGGGRSGGGFLPDGMRIKFTRTERWEDNNGNDTTGKVVLHLDTLRTEVRWGKDGKPVSPPRVLGPGEQYRDTEAVNETIPKEEWLPGFEKGQLRGPVQNQNVVVFGNLATMERYVWPSPVTTTGSAIAVRELNERVKRMRHFRGARVFAKVGFSRCLFPTRYNREQQRPHLEIIGWVEPTAHGLVQIDPRLLPSLQQVPAPKTAPDPTSPAPATPTASTQQAAPPWQDVDEPTLAEEMGDKIKF
jgi:hypothetical protein